MSWGKVVRTPRETSTNALMIPKSDIFHLRSSLGRAFNLKRNFSELAGVLAYFRKWKIAVKSVEELLFCYFGLV